MCKKFVEIGKKRRKSGKIRRGRRRRRRRDVETERRRTTSSTTEARPDVGTLKEDGARIRKTRGDLIRKSQEKDLELRKE